MFLNIAKAVGICSVFFSTTLPLFAAPPIEQLRSAENQDDSVAQKSEAASEPERTFTPEEQRVLVDALRHHDLAMECVKKREFTDAIAHMKIMVDTTRQVFGNNHGALAGKCEDMAKILQMAGRPKEAIHYYDEVLRLNLPEFGPNHPAIAHTYRTLSRCLVDAGDLKRCRETMDASLNSAKNAYGEQSLDYSVFLNDAAHVCEKLDLVDEAKRYLQSCRDIRSKDPNCSIFMRASCHNNLGHLLIGTGDYAQARIELDTALKLLAEDNADQRSHLADTLNNLGYLMRMQGDFQLAFEKFRAALQIQVQIFPEMHPSIAATLNNIGSVLMRQGKTDEAKSILTESLRIFLGTTGPNSIPTSNVVSLLGETAMKAGDYAEAQRLAITTSEIRARVAGEMHRSTGLSHYDVGITSMFCGDAKSAEEHFAKALKVVGPALGPQHPELARIHVGVGTFHASQNHVDEALRHFDQSQHIASHHARIVLPGLPRREQLHYFGVLSKTYQRSLAFAASHSENALVASASAQWLGNSKALAFESFARQNRLLLLAGKGDPTGKLLVEVRQQLAALAMRKPGDDAGDDNQNSYAESTKRWTARESELSRQLAAALGIRSPSSEWVDLDSIRSELNNGAALIDFAKIIPSSFDAKNLAYDELPEHYVVWVVRKDRSNKVAVVDLGPAQVIDQRIRDVREQIEVDSQKDEIARRGGERAASKEIYQKLRRLANLIFDPISPFLENADELVICPDSNLWLIPWAALTIDDENHFLVEQYLIRMLDSSRQLVLGKPSNNATPVSTINSSPPVIVADPDFDQPNSSNDSRRAVSIPENGSQDLQRLFSAVERLESTSDEAIQIESSIQSTFGLKSLVMLREKARESLVKQIQHPRFLVFSTHGFYLPDVERPSSDPTDMLIGSDSDRHRQSSAEHNGPQDPLLRCGLLLSGCNANSEVLSPLDDGILTGSEILALDLRGTELVMLAACDTGTGKVQNGDGIAGLRQAFHLAGARTVVATLWSVHSASTRTQTETFFRNYTDPGSAAKTLRAVQLEMIESRRSISGAAHPYFWAATTATGI